MHITDLPEEILDHAVDALASPIDLRNLAAVCCFIHLVEPYHTQFRVIRTPLISPLRKKIVGNRLLAQNVRILEVQPAEVDKFTDSMRPSFPPFSLIWNYHQSLNWIHIDEGTLTLAL